MQNYDHNFNWNEEYESDFDNVYDRDREELEEIARLIRSQDYNENIMVYVNRYVQLVIELNLYSTGTISSVKGAMELLNDIRAEHLSSFDAPHFEITIDRRKPVIYCTYEKF